MNIHIDNFDDNKLTPTLLTLMNYLHDYLDEDWKINKKNNSYILKKNGCKIIICEEMYIQPNRIKDDTESLKYILNFLYTVLNNGWTIKKSNDNYIFIKNHEGKKEFFSKNYINTFIKENFNLCLIK
jgi:hypothetical protein|tara:strand:- start:34 stop:414 length:381 start_codon:yes stop_codon:yes gene_type:complete